MRPPARQPARPALKRSRKFEPRASRPVVAPRLIRYLLVLVAVVVIIDSLFGERGLTDTLRARREYAALQGHISRVRADNARLREEARRLKEDSDAIESVAREELGLIHPGETLFIIASESARPARHR